MRRSNPPAHASIGEEPAGRLTFRDHCLTLWDFPGKPSTSRRLRQGKWRRPPESDLFVIGGGDDCRPGAVEIRLPAALLPHSQQGWLRCADGKTEESIGSRKWWR
ncbi:protein of unknown function [Cupriavidus taiwanensis]|uniref:Uncharacterized protein n=1 Tax=Cupriavidus taiwanensis TaxID=164546 RepID=A0A7Z7NMU7_9BURK|nr:protein of unknown function [Cupriavidus taiwanensis]SPC21324.1 protein of unknown function [Cupriavidus taiwanensis]